MGRRKETREIDGARYEIRQMGSLTALRVQAQLLKLLGEPMAKLVAAEGVTALLELDVDEGGDLIAEVVKTLAEHADPELIVDMASRMVIGNVTADIGGHMMLIEDLETYETVLDQRSPWHQLKLLQACVAVNFLPTGAGALTDLTRGAAPARPDGEVG